MKIIKYPDGSSYVELPLHSEPQPFTFKINSYEDLWHLNQIVDVWNSWYKLKPTITIPNLIDAQADKRFNKNESNGLKLVCKFLNTMNANFKIFHPHNPEVVEALMDNVEIIDNSMFIQQVLYKLHLSKIDNPILMSSDAGGFKPLMKLCDKINWKGHTESASKYRNPQNSKLIQTINKQNFEGRDILIVDDLCIYGGTFKGLAKILRECNAGKLYLAVSHMTVQQLGNDPVTDYFDMVFTTNSKFNSYLTGHSDKIPPKNLNVIKLF